MEEISEKVPETIGKNFKIVKNISKGSFGEIYEAINTKTGCRHAIKFESIKTLSPQLIFECKMYRYLLNDSSVIDKGLPNIYYCSEQGNYNVLVMDLMGPSLRDLFNETFRKFSLKTVLMIIDQMISRVEYLHKKKILHRDIKPDNFCIGLNKTAHKIFLIDLGLSQKYVKRDGKHIPYADNKSFTGTARYASINTHQGIQQSRRDDMESIGYVALQFLRGQLIWEGIQAKNKHEKHQLIEEKKRNTPLDVLCKGYPEEFKKYLIECRNLDFQEVPNYSSMRAMFKDLFNRKGYTFDYKYDWVILNNKKLNSTSNKQNQLSGINIENKIKQI